MVHGAPQAASHESGGGSVMGGELRGSSSQVLSRSGRPPFWPAGRGHRRRGRMRNKANFRVFGLKTRVHLRIEANWRPPCRVGRALEMACGVDSLRRPADCRAAVSRAKGEVQACRYRARGARNFGCQRNVRVIYMTTFGDTRILARWLPWWAVHTGRHGGASQAWNHTTNRTWRPRRKCGAGVGSTTIEAPVPASPTILLDLLSASCG